MAPLDMAELAALTSLPLRARCLADAIGVGRHRSLRRGASVEFADYRDYHVGDDLRRVDWRLLARTDRAHIREAYEETPLRVLLLLDVSASMNYASRGALLTKLDFARSLLGALALLVQRQRDAGGVGLLAGDLESYQPPSASPARFQSVWATLENPALTQQANVVEALARAIDMAPRSCLFVIASDFYDGAAALEPLIGRLRYERHDALALHISDPQEVNFDFSDPVFFEDAETGERLPLDPAVTGPGYRAAFAAHQSQIGDLFLHNGFGHLALRTDAPPLAALGAYLARRSGQV